MRRPNAKGVILLVACLWVYVPAFASSGGVGLPVSFSPAGDAAGPRFAVIGSKASAILTPEGISFGIRSRTSLRFAGGRAATIEPEAPLPGVTNIFVGRDPRAWRTALPRYGAVRYRNVWPGIDVVFRGDAGDLEFDAIVRPGADPSRIVLACDGSARMERTGRGDLRIGPSYDAITLHAPEVFQEENGTRRHVDGAFVLLGGGRARFALGRHDPARELTIDPVITYSTYLGGDGAASGTTPDGAVGDAGYNVARDLAGNTYVVGYTGSTNFPVTGPIHDAYAGNEDAFVAKFGPTGDVDYVSILGGSGLDRFTGVAVGDDGGVYLDGYTTSLDLPTTSGVYQRNYVNVPPPNEYSGFAVKLTPAGDHVAYCTYVGGGSFDITYRIAVDRSGNAYLGGYTILSTYGGRLHKIGPAGGAVDVLVVKLNADASDLVYVVGIGGSGYDQATDMKIDAAGRIYLGGVTNSTDFPFSSGAFQQTCACTPNQGLNDQAGFFARLNAAGTALDYASYLGSSETRLSAVVPDGTGGIWATGMTTDPNFPVRGNPVQSLFGAGTQDGFVSHLSADGKSLLYSTFFGSWSEASPAVAAQTGGRGLAIDAAGRVFVCGAAGPGSLPVANALPGQAAFAGGNSDGFVGELDSAGQLLFGSYLGGNGDDIAYKVAVDNCGRISVAGSTTSTNFPTLGSPYQSSYTGTSGFPNAFVTMLQADSRCFRYGVSGVSAGAILRIGARP